MPASRQLSEVRIERGAEADALAAVPMINRAFEVETFFNTPRTDEAEVREMLTRGEFLIAKDGAHTVGIIYVEARGESGYLGMLAVDAACRGRGLGRQLIAAAEQRCSRTGCSRIDICVLSLRPELLARYARLGFVETGREPLLAVHKLRPGFDAHVVKMSKNLL